MTTNQRWPDRQARGDHYFGLLLLAPALVLVLVFIVFPVGYSLWLSVHDVVLTRPSTPQFVGLENFAGMLANDVFVGSLWKTLYYSVTFLVATVGGGLLVALVLNQRFFAQPFVIACLLIPWAAPRVVNGLMWKWIYDGNFGVLNEILLRLGAIDSYRFWFSESPLIGLFLISFANIWKFTPFVALLLLAALQTVPEELYEAAKVDGAGAFRRLFAVTLPHLRHTLTIVLILQTMRAVKVFDLVAVLTKGGPADRTMLTYYYVYTTAFEYLRISSAAAGAYLVTAVIMLLAIGYHHFLRVREETV